MDQHPLMQEQIELEGEMRLATRHRYFRTHEKAEDRGDLSDTHTGRSVLDHVLEQFTLAVDAWVVGKKSGKPGRRPRAVSMLEEFRDTPALSYIFTKHLINTTMKVSSSGSRRRVRTTQAALNCTQAIHDELRMRFFAENRRALLKKIVKDFQQRELPRRRRRELMIKQFNTQKLDWVADGWGKSERLNLGLVLIDIFQQTTGMIEEYVSREGTKTYRCLSFTPEILSLIADRMDKAADLFTVYYPTVVPPRPWGNDALVGGGYYTDNVKPYLFVKGAKVRYLRELESRDMSRVLDPVNAMQNTGWRINPVMADVLEYVYNHNIEAKGLTRADPASVPDAPPGVDEDEDTLAAYRKECYMVHDMNRRMISKRVSVLRTVAMAQRFMGYDAIYFPYDVDSRGRVYPKVPFLNPQGPDYVKALLEFSEGKPIDTPEAEFYLSVAIANAWGQDKLPLQERADWVFENQDMLLEVARDPQSDHRWLQADEPFMALRGALEWLGLCQYGDGYLSHMPIHFDATCSGLQHFSALLRDAEGGFHVNLTNCDDRQDIYAAVAEKAVASLTADTSDIARVALEIGITRAMCKRPVMIVPYAGTFSSCMDYVNEYYREIAEAGTALPMELLEIRTTLTPVVAKHIWKAIASTVIAAREAMDWITHTARLASKGSEVPIQWTTPDGFVVQQAKHMERAYSVETYLDGGRRVQSKLVEPTRKLDPRKMAQSLSPNYIHSLDACHMRGAIRKALEVGDMSFAMIHDSFGVHAADMDTFVHGCIKPAFVEMYEAGDNLDLFRAQVVLNVTEDRLEDIKELPTMGTLDIHEVQDSQFFFS